jgi:alpha-mannosidase
VQSVFLPEAEAYVEFESWWVMGQSVHPEGTYVVFPFNLPGATARIDLGGQVMVAGKDQFPGVCFDYYTAQQFVDLSNPERGVNIALPENPMVQFGDFHFGHNQREFKLNRAMLLGWVTNTYWETNFRAHQPGGVHARYRVYPHSGGFDSVRSQRQGLETAFSQPLLQHMGEPKEKGLFPASGELLRLPENLEPDRPVFTLHVKPTRKDGGLLVRLFNAGDTPQTARIGSGLLQIMAAQLCDLSENPQQSLEVTGGEINFPIPAHQFSTLRLIIQ